jgi:hypothetical protein
MLTSKHRAMPLQVENAMFNFPSMAGCKVFRRKAVGDQTVRLVFHVNKFAIKL